MRTRTKILGLAMAALLLMGATILGTMAYLTSQDEVKNTFTVGSVKITLDETKVDEYGKVDATATAIERVKANEYKLIPGGVYIKDPIVHVEGGSEAAWLFVEVNNGIAAIEDEENNIAAQIKGNGWEALTEGGNVYFKQYAGGEETSLDYPVFENFKIKGEVTNETLAGYAEATVTVTAYAVQASGFDTAAAAWAATFGAPAGE